MNNILQILIYTKLFVEDLISLDSYNSIINDYCFKNLFYKNLFNNKILKMIKKKLIFSDIPIPHKILKKI